MEPAIEQAVRRRDLQELCELEDWSRNEAEAKVPKLARSKNLSDEASLFIHLEAARRCTRIKSRES